MNEFTPTTQELLDYGFHTSDLKNYERFCERGEIRYSRDTNTFSQRSDFAQSFRQIKVPNLEEMKAYIWALNESEI